MLPAAAQRPTAAAAAATPPATPVPAPAPVMTPPPVTAPAPPPAMAPAAPAPTPAPVAPPLTAPVVEAIPEPETVAHPEPDSAGPKVDGRVEQAERLARIVVSDIVLYSKEKFEAAVAAGNVLEAMQPELAEGRSLFAARVDPAIQEMRDFLQEELLRVAAARGKP